MVEASHQYGYWLGESFSTGRDGNQCASQRGFVEYMHSCWRISEILTVDGCGRATSRLVEPDMVNIRRGMKHDYCTFAGLCRFHC